MIQLRFALLFAACLLGSTSAAQQITNNTSSQTLGDGFAENLGFNFSQSSSRSNVSAAQSGTALNGAPSSFFSGEIRPFVTGITPIVGGYPNLTSPLAEMAAADQRTKLSGIAERNAKYKNDKLRSYLVRAERAESEGDMKMARANYRLALGYAAEPLRSKIQAVMQERFSGRQPQATGQK